MSTPGRYGDGRGSHGLSLLPQDVPAAVAAIRAGTASAVVRLAVEFVILTCGCPKPMGAGNSAVVVDLPR